MDRAIFEAQVKAKLHQELWPTLTPLGKAVHRAKARVMALAIEERGCDGIENKK